MLDGEAVFIPDEVPRRGLFALRGTGSGAGNVAVGPDAVLRAGPPQPGPARAAETL